MIKGKLNDFVKFRGTRISTPYSINKVRMDHSFHSNQDKIDAWMAILEEDSDRRSEQIFRGVTDLLRLIRRMMAQNALLRPTALEVRDRIREILVDQCGVETLCCAGREWDLPVEVNFPTHAGARDSVSIAMGALRPPPSRKGSDCQRSGSVCGDHVSVLSHADTNISTSTRHRSSAGTASARISDVWRRAFTRAA